MDAPDLVKLTPLMVVSSGRPQIKVGLIDGPVALDHPELARDNIREIPGQLSGMCTMANSSACVHGTLIAGVLSAKRGSTAPAICPGCTLLIRPIFGEKMVLNGRIPSANPTELAAAIVDCIEAGVHIVNLSAAMIQPSSTGQHQVADSLDYAASRNVIVVAAAGNQGTIGSTVITGHPWVIPVIAYDHQGRPMSQSNLGSSIGRRGLGAPGESVTSLGADGKSSMIWGTSVAAPFVTGAIALLRSLSLNATAAQVKHAITEAHVRRRSTVVPPLMNAWRAYQSIAALGL